MRNVSMRFSNTALSNHIPLNRGGRLGAKTRHGEMGSILPSLLEPQLGIPNSEHDVQSHCTLNLITS